MTELFTEEQMDEYANQVFMPLVLIINCTLCDYLLVFYWKRRRELRIRLLFLVSVLGTVCLVPFARPNKEFVRGLNDLSESCVVVTLLTQITVIGHDLNVRFEIKSVMYLTRVAEFLIVADSVMVLLSFIATFAPGVMSQQLAEDNK